MSYLDYYDNLIKQFYINNDAVDKAATQRALDKLPHKPVYYIDSQEEIPKKHQNAGTLYLTSPRGEVVGHCPGSKNHVCCNYITMDVYLGCTLGCSYCIMKGYLNFSPITIYVDPKPGIESVIKLAEQNKDRILRIGTGEVGDSLQFDPLFEISKEYIEAFAKYPNIQFEMKTKTNFVDHLLNIENKGRAIIAFSLNPREIQKVEEPFTATIDERLAAAKKAEAAGYDLAFHFDPIIKIDGWEEKYTAVAKELSQFKLESIQWISLGTFRYTQKLKENMADRKYLYDEFVTSIDGKQRYIQKERSSIYSTMFNRLQLSTGAPVYMCMESEAVWENVYHNYPENIEKLKTIFTEAKGVSFHPSSRRGD